MLPEDLDGATLAGRFLLDAGPTPIVIRGGAVEDVSRSAPTIADLMDLEDPAAVAGEHLFDVGALEGMDSSGSSRPSTSSRSRPPA